MVKLVFVHGWGCDRTLWSKLTAELDGYDCDYVDQGFFGPGSVSLPSEPFVFVTHSMGLIWALTHFRDDCRGLFVVNGFSKFSQADDWEAGVHPRLLQRMIRKFEGHGRDVWQEFMRNTGWEDAKFPAQGDLEKLKKALESLLQSDGRDLYAGLSVPKRIVASTHDAIVPAALSRASFGETVDWIDGGNHMLPLSHPSALAKMITSFVETLDLE